MTINLAGSPLTVQSVVQILTALCTDGEVTVLNCHKSPDHVHRILAYMNSRLSEEDKNWIRATIQEELKPKRPWVTT